MCGSQAPDPPNYGKLVKAMNKQSKRQDKVSREQLSWSKEQYEDQKKVLSDVLEVQLPLMKQAAERSEADRKMYEDYVQPLEKAMYRDAQTYDTEGRREQEATRSKNDVAASFDATRRAGMRQLESFGLDPSEARYGALDSQTRVSEALATVQAGTDARTRIEETGRDMKQQAVGVGRGLNASSLANTEAATRTGSSSVADQNRTVGTAAPGLGNAAGWSGMATSSIGQAGNLMNQQYTAEMGEYNSNQASSPWGAIGGLVGTGVGAYYGGAAGAKVGGEAGSAAGGQVGNQTA